ncbi:protein of unknown function [Legionella fallonii LLAP-10]|uniref:Uncharacterized protein n=1 Tax=Legionella fallonii LLAP-10 TaxID=1212491 RepID=A0A098G825_9GAMM|nr:protein of unknown function [Legionella fallonii LLAP-10]
MLHKKNLEQPFLIVKNNYFLKIALENTLFNITYLLVLCTLSDHVFELQQCNWISTESYTVTSVCWAVKPGIFTYLFTKPRLIKIQYEL